MASAENGSQAVVAVGEVKSALPAPQLDVVETQTKAIGIIQPPHQIRLIIDKTAGFVAKTGASSLLRASSMFCNLMVSKFAQSFSR